MEQFGSPKPSEHIAHAVDPIELALKNRRDRALLRALVNTFLPSELMDEKKQEQARVPTNEETQQALEDFRAAQQANPEGFATEQMVAAKTIERTFESLEEGFREHSRRLNAFDE